MLNKLPLAWRLSLMVLVSAGLIMGIIVGYLYFQAERLLVLELEDKADYMAVATANRIETVERAVSKVALELAALLKDVPPTKKTLYTFLESTVYSHDEIFGGAIAMDPEDLPRDPSYRAPYVCRSGDTLVAFDLGEGDYHYEVWEWYTIPVQLDSAVWSEPYFDTGGGNALMVTHSVPFYSPGKEGDMLGVVTSDVLLETLTSDLDELQLGESSYAFLLTQNGTFVTHPNKDFVMRETIFSVAEARGDEQLRQLGQRMLKNESAFVPYTCLYDEKPGWLVYVPIENTGWTLGVFFPEELLMAKVWELSRWVLIFGAIGFALLLVVVLFIARSITGPIAALNDATEILAAGQLDAPLPEIKGEDEVARLASSFIKMRDDLKIYIEESVEKRKMEEQLALARQIQEGFLPQQLPETPGIGVHGYCEFCLEAAGDYYDVIAWENKKTILAIGDVSGKGAGAALLMANLQASLRTSLPQMNELDKVVFNINNLIDTNTPSGQFITFFVAVYDPETRKLIYVNAGHNPPLLFRNDGKTIEELGEGGGLFLGGMPDMPYEAIEVQLEKDDVLFMFTDGVTEAFNKNQEEFTEEGVKAHISAFRDKPLKNILTSLREHVVRFQGHDRFEDDFTMLIVRVIE